MNHSRLPTPDPALDEGLALISQLPLANPSAARSQLLSYLDLLLSQPPGPLVLLELLEAMREPMAFVQGEAARPYLNKPLPLLPHEETLLYDVSECWRLMVKAYATCARLVEPDPNDPYYAARIATILHRCLYYTGQIIFEHYRARCELPSNLWIDLHGYYETAEEWGVSLTPIEDVLEGTEAPTHCAAAYITILLVDVASPYGLTIRQLNLIRRWATQWSPMGSIHRLSDDGELPSFVVELMQDTPLHYAGGGQNLRDDARWLDTSRIGLHIHHYLAQLQQRNTPAQLGLGEESSAAVQHLLQRLQRPWSQLASPRRFRRFGSDGNTRVALGFPAIHFHISGKAFAQPAAASMYSHDAYMQMATYGERVAPDTPLSVEEQVTYPTESWAVLNHSASGFRLSRPPAGQRIGHNQLLGVCPHDGNLFLLCRITWLLQEGDGNVVAGVATLPGVPQPVGIRPVNTRELFVRAFLLDPVPGMEESGSLILPSGLYQARKGMELASGNERQQIRLNCVLDRGLDFDRISYDPF